MIILDEKMPPPPPYTPPPGQVLTTPPPFPPPFPYSSREPPRLDTLPPHLLLRIVYATFTDTASIEKQRKTLYWLNVGLRLVSRALYVACMHVLRSTYLPAYADLIRAPYSSDPFPLTSPALSPAASSSLSPIQSLQRETRVLDLFIALTVREDVWADESELHLEREESFRDVFDLMQPRSRLEDLVRAYGLREGVVTLNARTPAVCSVPVTPTSPTAATSSGSSLGLGGFGASFGWGGKKSREKEKEKERDKGKGKEKAGRGSLRSKPVPLVQSPAPLPFAALSASFSSRKVGIVLTTRESKRTIVEVGRTRDERLESSAKKIVEELRNWLAESM